MQKGLCRRRPRSGDGTSRSGLGKTASETSSLFNSQFLSPTERRPTYRSEGVEWGDAKGRHG